MNAQTATKITVWTLGTILIVLGNCSRACTYLGAYAYCFHQLFQGLCLFRGLRLLGTVEYVAYMPAIPVRIWQ